MIRKFLRKPPKKRLSRNDLIRREARLGGTIFGPVPKGHDRQFFNLDPHTWIWHESWPSGRDRVNVTTKYEIRGNQIFKTQGNQPMKLLTGPELDNLVKATEIYTDLISSKLYPRLIAA